MRKDIAGQGVESTVPTFEDLESFVRGRVQGFIQSILDEEVTELLGRQKSERIQAVDGPKGYRNGHGKPRKLTMSSGTITVRRPLVRDLDELFESRVLPLFARRTKEVGKLIPELYLHGLAEGDFDLALRGLLGEDVFMEAYRTFISEWSYRHPTPWDFFATFDREILSNDDDAVGRRASPWPVGELSDVL